MENKNIISFRANSKTEKDIIEIKKQMENHPMFKYVDITDSYIIRLALSSLNENLNILFGLNKRY